MFIVPRRTLNYRNKRLFIPPSSHSTKTGSRVKLWKASSEEGNMPVWHHLDLCVCLCVWEWGCMLSEWMASCQSNLPAASLSIVGQSVSLLLPTAAAVYVCYILYVYVWCLHHYVSFLHCSLFLSLFLFLPLLHFIFLFSSSLLPFLISLSLVCFFSSFIYFIFFHLFKFVPFFFFK